jgi:effector-binding domain-containing protein
MNYHLEQHRDFLTPVVFTCLQGLLQQIQQFNDENTFNKWKKLITVLLDRNYSITSAFNAFMNEIKGEQHSDKYMISIYMMFIKYENSMFVRNI